MPQGDHLPFWKALFVNLTTHTYTTTTGQTIIFSFYREKLKEMENLSSAKPSIPQLYSNLLKSSDMMAVIFSQLVSFCGVL